MSRSSPAPSFVRLSRRLVALGYLTHLLLLPACSSDSEKGGGEGSGGSSSASGGQGGGHPSGAGAGGEAGSTSTGGDGSGGNGLGGDGSGGDGSGGDGPAPPCAEHPEGLRLWWSQEPFFPPPDAPPPRVREELRAQHGIVDNFAGQASWGRGPVGFGFFFDGELIVKVNVSYTSPLPHRSMELWIQAEAASAGRTPLFQSSAENRAPEFALFLNEGKLEIEFRDPLPPTRIETLTASSALDDGKAHHLVITQHSEDRTDMVVRLYVDGALDLEERIAAFNPDFYSPLYLGRGVDEESEYFGDFRGYLDELSLYDRALSASEVSALFAAKSSGKCGATFELPF